jgi:hypothetical protein
LAGVDAFFCLALRAGSAGCRAFFTVERFFAMRLYSMSITVYRDLATASLRLLVFAPNVGLLLSVH